MIPYPYNMVDMGGIDLAEANGTVVEGLYAKIVEAVNSCGDTVLYNWKFASIEIAPQHTQILLGIGVLTINTLIQVTEQDVVTVLGIAPPPPPVVPVEPLNVTENGTYEAQPPASGFNPVVVDVDNPVEPLNVTENGTYEAQSPASGFNPVVVNVDSSPRIYVNNQGGESPYKINVDQGGQIVKIGNNIITKNTGTPVFAAVAQSTSGYKCLVLAIQSYAGTVDDVKTSGTADFRTTTIDDVTWYYSSQTGIVGDYLEGPAVFVNSVTGGSWNPIINALLQLIASTPSIPNPYFRPETTGYIPVPEGYDGFGPLLIN